MRLPRKKSPQPERRRGSSKTRRVGTFAGGASSHRHPVPQEGHSLTIGCGVSTQAGASQPMSCSRRCRRHGDQGLTVPSPTTAGDPSYKPPQASDSAGDPPPEMPGAREAHRAQRAHSCGPGETVMTSCYSMTGSKRLYGQEQTGRACGLLFARDGVLRTSRRARPFRARSGLGLRTAREIFQYNLGC
jgi:hypothetical protein